MSELSVTDAKTVLESIRSSKPHSQIATRHNNYVEYRRNCEQILRSEFLKKGGVITRSTPHYMVVEHSPWLASWYEDCDYINIPITEFDTRTLSFTYGDSMPTFSPNVRDQKEYRHKLYTYEEILHLIDKYGLPQDWNNDGRFGPERYIEVHVWTDEPLRRYYI